MIPYYKVLRLLLYPQLSERNLDLDYLKLCANACAGICAAYKRLHRIGRADCSPFAVQALFLTGLTLLHCTWLAPRNYLSGVMTAISDCNLMLYVMAERCQPAQKYRDVFERINSNVTEVIAQDNHQATQAEGVLDAEMLERCRALDQGLPVIVRTPYSQIISDLAKDRKRSSLLVTKDPSDELSKNEFRQQVLAPEVAMPPAPMMDYDYVGFAHPSFIDSGFTYNWEDLDSMGTNWTLPNTWNVT
jgi:hypothetical protein